MEGGEVIPDWVSAYCIAAVARSSIFSLSIEFETESVIHGQHNINPFADGTAVNLIMINK